MSVPVEMRCLHPNDYCPSPFRCHSAGGCIEAQRDGSRSYREALAACRERGLIPESWKREERA